MDPVDIEGAARDYRESLAELRNNNKTQINFLTILADDFKGAAKEIVDVIETHLTTCAPSQKLPVMYVCDSILKNVAKPNDYHALFARKIINMFEHIFRQGEEGTRSSLYRLRVTWGTTGAFLPSKLYELDMKINRMDQAWPISNPNTGRALRTDPQVMVNAPSTSRPSSSGATTSAAASIPPARTGVAPAAPPTRVFVNPRFIDAAGASAIAAQQTTTKTKKTSEKTKASSSGSSSVKEKPIKKEPKERKQDPLDKLLPSTAGESSKSSAPPGSKRKSIPAEHPSAPIRKKNPQPALDEDLRSINLSNKSNVSQHARDQDFRPKALAPTSVIGSHAFAPPVTRTVVPPIVPPTHFIPLPPQPAHPMPPFSLAPQPSTPQTIVSNGMNGGPYHHHSPPQDPAPMATMAQVAPMAPPVQMASSQQSKNVYSSEQTKLDVPANNRIFVDGKAYEVMFVDDTAVIERGGAPHRIYFAGPKRDLLIDGIAHTLEFDKATPVEILGSTHIVKFGAPSRELYIGGHPFKGQFGGPPIVATINGRRHEIRLTGSAPEVRIEPEPSYHLTHFLHKMREEKKIEIASEKPEKKEDWLSYLKSLQKSGILPPVKNPSPRQQVSPPPATSNHNYSNGARGGRQNQRGPGGQSRWGAPEQKKPILATPPTPTGNGIEKRNSPPTTITDYNIRVLQVRYDSVVDALITKRSDSCTICGMRLDDSQGKSKEWQDHMDWHVKQNLARHGSNSSAAAIPYRQWYPSTSTWLTPRASEQPSDQNAEKQGSPLPGVDSAGVKTKECSVCGEKFDEYYDDDEEMWRLRDTVSHNGRIVHAACASDADSHFFENSTYFADAEIKKEEPYEDGVYA
ncbi:unnamed protein product [Caenorhabditis nigoni]